MRPMIRPTESCDASYLKRWLAEPGILKKFPMTNTREVEDSIRLWMSYIPKESAITASVDGNPVGMAVIYVQPFEKLRHQALFAIIVDPGFRGKGIGTVLLKEVEKIAKKKHGIELLHLEVYEGNPAYNLYKRLGYHEYGVQKGYLKEGPDEYSDKICMQKAL